MCLQLLKSLSSKSIDCLHQCVYSTEIITMSNTGFPHITAIKCGRRFQNDVMHVDRAQLVFAQNFPFKAQEASWIHLVIHHVKWFDTEELPNWTNTSEIHKPMWDKTHANCLVPANELLWQQWKWSDHTHTRDVWKTHQKYRKRSHLSDRLELEALHDPAMSLVQLV